MLKPAQKLLAPFGIVGPTRAGHGIPHTSPSPVGDSPPRLECPCAMGGHRTESG